MSIKTRCDKCKKKKLFLNKCKCEYDLCLDCLPFFIHECTFDWKREKCENLTKINPKIEYIKVSDI